MRRPARAAICALALLAAALASREAGAQEGILGEPPTYSSRHPGTSPEGPLPNEAAITRRIWAPGIDDGYVPQGLTVVAGSIYLGSYRSTERAVDRGPCRLFRIDPATGAVTGTLDLPPACGHAGGLARGAPGRIWVVDTQVMHEIALSSGNEAGIGSILREVRISPPLKGSFAAGDGESIWLGSYERDKAGKLWRVPLAAIATLAIGEAQATASIPLPSRAQGAAFDPAGRLWVTRSGSTLGELAGLDPQTGTIEARYRLPDGVEDLSFDAAGKLWTVSEAGSRRWSGWATFFPVVFQVDPARLR
jgi:hypothetical protein